MRAVGSDDPTCDMGWVDAEPTAAFGQLEWFLPRDSTGSPLRPVAFVPKR